MTFWNRQATLQIGTAQWDMDELEFSFKVTFDSGEKLPTCEVEVKNLSQTRRKAIRKGDLLIINAGYEGDIGVLFAGEVTSRQNEKSGTEWSTKLLASPIAGQWISAQVNKTYRAGYASDIIRDLLRIFGVEIGQFTLKKDRYYQRGKLCKGKLKDVLRNIVVQDCKSSFAVKNQAVYISATGGSEKLTYELTEESGLLTAKKNKSEPSSDNTEPITDTVTCLLNYHIGSGDKIRIRSLELNGDFKVIRGSHSGSRSGIYQTALEVVTL
jgi:hypothetical protein